MNTAPTTVDGAPITTSRTRSRRRIAAFVGAAFLVLLVADNLRPPAGQAGTRLLIASIDAYKATVAPHVPSRCPFTPTCSVYARRAIEKYGAVKGALLAVWRVMRCSPLTKTFGVDEP